MRKFVRSCQGSVAFATVIALVPLIGVLALGAEAGSWYVIHQQAQNAADAAAYSGGLLLECTTVQSAGGQTCTDTQTADYRARQFAAQHAFCDANDTTSYPGAHCPTGLPSGTSQSVSVTVSATQVQVTVSQTQPTYFANVLGLSNFVIRATATAEVNQLAFPCVLSLTDPLAFQGNTTVSAPNCGLSSNDKNPSGAIQFTGNSVNLSQVKSVSAVGGCSQTGGNQCSTAITSAAATPNPLSELDTAISSMKVSTDFPDGKCPVPSGNSPIALPAYGSPLKCYYDGSPFASNKDYTFSGVYFFADGQIKFQSNKYSGTATLIFLPAKLVSGSDKTGATWAITGNTTFTISAPTSVTASQVPPTLQSTANLKLLAGLLLYDPESSSNLNISGNSSSNFTGVTYAPNADVTYQGSTLSSGCNEVIAKGVTLSGSSTFDNTKCASSAISGAVTHYVRLVQ
jgi:hypothetical protein